MDDVQLPRHGYRVITTKSPEFLGTHFLESHKRMKGWLTQWFQTRDLSIGNPVP